MPACFRSGTSRENSDLCYEPPLPDPLLPPASGREGECPLAPGRFLSPCSSNVILTISRYFDIPVD
jgi:hypothetical protein